MPNNKSIHILRGRTSSTSEPNAVDNTLLEDGQPFYDKRTNTLRIGDGTNAVKDVKPVTVADGAITDVKVADNAAIKGSKLADASNDESNRTGITTAKIEDKTITTDKIADKNVTSAKLATDLINTGSASSDGMTVSLSQDTGTSKFNIGISGTATNATNVTTKIKNIAIDNIFSTPSSGNTLIPKYPKFESRNGNLYITTKP